MGCEIVSGYQPGVIGRIAEMHGTYYARAYQFGQFFESQVAAGLAEFAGRLPPVGHTGNALWTAWEEGQDGDRIVASVAIDAEDLGHGAAHLRWFIVDGNVRGSGVGRQLLQRALAFCDEKAFASVHLWTFRGLDAARHLYESNGFVLVDEKLGTQWGAPVQEQHFVRTL